MASGICFKVVALASKVIIRVLSAVRNPLFQKASKRGERINQKHILR